MTTGLIAANLPVHTTLELFGCITIVMRFLLGTGGMFKNYRGSGTVAGMTLCILVDSGTLTSIGIYAARASVVVHTLYCYWKIVHPVHQRRYHRVWMVYVGTILPWSLGVATKLPLAATTADIVNGVCRPRAHIPTEAAFKVRANSRVCVCVCV